MTHIADTHGEVIRSHAAFVWSVADLIRGDFKQSEYAPGDSGGAGAAPLGQHHFNVNGRRRSTRARSVSR